MKRDDEYIRKLLLELEESDDTYIVSSLAINADEEDEKQHYHLQLLSDAGLMVEEERGVFRMTNQGHDFLAAVRSETIWKKTKVGAGQVGGVTLGILKDIATAYLKQEVASRLGITLQ
ncbi:hypothetical protein BTR14_03180 [Rhizobium rhizosphaerae]|uniref:DUF2513 domain-containing protein n=1 Tax=Xaviernesmea rhizosphaerae TaxID=1672749 RepID=A0ABX3PHC9_9HYPH|nr:DUF2513 domain-containing protein [Xaviernesmea rhizosphaerae]OQP87585.1 hypothetical protein BTR14_03180 [Xaviernesmea rhizosphaerae]